MLGLLVDCCFDCGVYYIWLLTLIIWLLVLDMLACLLRFVFVLRCWMFECCFCLVVLDFVCFCLWFVWFVGFVCCFVVLDSLVVCGWCNCVVSLWLII